MSAMFDPGAFTLSMLIVSGLPITTVTGVSAFILLACRCDLAIGSYVDAICVSSIKWVV